MNQRLRNFIGIWVFVLLAFTVVVTAASAAPEFSNELRCETHNAIHEAVERLQDAPSFRAALSSLAAAPANGACHLIEALRVVPDKTLLPAEQQDRPDTMKIIWSLRALCSITGGLRFTADTQYRFNLAEESQRQRLDFLRTRDGGLRFFGVWMSRDVLYIAPRDAQAAIIDEWIKWHMANGETFNYTFGGTWEDCYF